jgi:succinoglycan biosynthesis transport protein ExoP
MTLAPVTMDRNDAGGEEMLRLVQSLFLSATKSAPREIVFCGVDKENGSSAVCASAGRTLATYSSRSVCIVDAGRSPELSSLLRVEAVAPRDAISVRERCIKIDQNLWFAGADLLADEHGALLAVDILKQRLAELSAAFDFVLIDAPGAGASADAAILGQMVNGTILVVDANVTRRIAARKAKEFLDAAGVRLLGAVLHDRAFPTPKGLYDRL